MTTGSEYYKAQAETLETIMRGIGHVEQNDDLIHSELGGGERELYDDLIAVMGKEDRDDITSDDLQEFLDEYALCIDKSVVYSILLTFGGPNASIDVTVQDGVISHMSYEFGWGGERFSRMLNPDDAMWQYAERQVETMIECER